MPDHTRPSRASRRSLAAVTLALAAGAAPATADDWPTLRPGLWEYQRTLGAKQIASKRCLDPVADMKRQNAVLEKNGCAISPLRRSGSSYTFESTCDMKTPGGSIRSASVSVMTVESDSAYRLEVRGTMAGEPTSETMTARRVGDCKP
jgi:hypothetical protein